jgi:small-conductance mechanosensitive channel
MDKHLADLLNRWNLSDHNWNLLLIGIAVVAGLLIRGILALVLRRKAKETDHYSFFSSLATHLGAPLTYFLPVFVFNLLLPLMVMPPVWMGRIGKILGILLIVLFAWFLIRAINVVQDVILYRFNPRKANNLRERRIITQLQFIRRLITVVIILLAIAAILLSFEAMRNLGTGLLTGVGVGGIIIGFAAQKSLGNLLAGFQIAFTQPIRLDDEVVVEGEFGKIEEITLTYVVVKIWDDRRMVLPINYFIEHHFENWTRQTADMQGTVFIYADFGLPVEPVRIKLKELLKDHPLWDGRSNGLVVTDVSDRTIELRATVSGKSSGNVYDLRCFVREELVKYITEHFPEHLPKTRTNILEEEDG